MAQRMAPRGRQFARNPPVSMMALAPVSVPSLPKSRAQDPTHTRSRRALALPAPRDASNVQKVGKTVHAPPACQHGRSLGSMLEGLATACGYRVPERHTTTVKRCNMELDAVLLMSCAYTADGLGCERIESRDQGGGPTRPAGLRSRPSTRAAGMVSQMKAAVARSRPEDRSAAPRDGSCCRLKTYSQPGANM